jgi:hypothetical protein
MLLVLVTVAWTFSGCATTEPPNASSRPWNTSKSWETGLPGGFFERR